MKSIYSIARRTFVASAAAWLSIGSAHAQWTVFDPANYGNAILREIHQLDQLAAQGRDEVQQLKDYKLQLENSQQLGGTIRAEIQQNLQQQLLNNVRDFGKSNLNKSATIDPNSGSYYVQAEDIINQNIGAVPRSAAATDADLMALGLQPGQQTGIGQQNYRDRMQYERVMDDMRQVALTRKNSEVRAVQANNITSQMATLSDNNTVGAIQLLGAQNALVYAQNEDAIKAQTTLIKNMQEQQARELVEREAMRQHEIDRLNRIRTNPQVTNVNMIP